MNPGLLPRGAGTYTLGALGIMLGIGMLGHDVLALFDGPELSCAQLIRPLLGSEGLWVILGNILFMYLRRGVTHETKKAIEAAESMAEGRAKEMLKTVLDEIQRNPPKGPQT